MSKSCDTGKHEWVVHIWEYKGHLPWAHSLHCFALKENNLGNRCTHTLR